MKINVSRRPDFEHAQVWREEISAVRISDAVCVHRAIGLKPAEDLWTVSHSPTGFAFIVAIEGKARAMKAARKLAKIADWSRLRSFSAGTPLSEMPEWYQRAGDAVRAVGTESGGRVL